MLFVAAGESGDSINNGSNSASVAATNNVEMADENELAEPDPPDGGAMAAQGESATWSQTPDLQTPHAEVVGLNSNGGKIVCL